MSIRHTRSCPECRVSRRRLIQGVAATAIGTGLNAARVAQSMAIEAGLPGNAAGRGQSLRPIWKLARPKAALPNSYFWTWDHSTNWMLDDPGMLNFGCDNRYLKQSETYVEDYRRLTDLAAGLGVKGVLIWGFLRDAHGGIDAAKRVADYAAAKGVAIMPGVGTNWYGGVYYEGDHPYNIETFLKKNPDARSLNPNGSPRANSICPLDPRFTDWLKEGVQWLFREFSIGGANLENGDFMVCHCPRCKKHKAEWPQDEADFWRYQFLGYDPALRAIQGQLADKLVTWATYKGFVPSDPKSGHRSSAVMECARPALVDRLPSQGLCQWTLTAMVHRRPLALTKYLDEGSPKEALANPVWAAEVKPPTRRSVGFLHQGSQWSHTPRYEQIVSTIKEGCLRAYRAGLEGVSIHGEVSSMHVPWALNYLAFSHFIHWPEDSLRHFGRKTLSQVLGGEDQGEAFAELLAHWDAGSLTETHKRDLQKRKASLQSRVAAGSQLGPWRFWNWLACVATQSPERHTSSIF